jgi:hypothetical protein
MSVTMPDLWPDVVKPAVLSPAAILRVQAAKLKQRTDGLLEAVVDSAGQMRGEKLHVLHRLELEVPSLNYYRHGILVAEHENPGAYPVFIVSSILDAPDDSQERAPKPIDEVTHSGKLSGTRCADEQEFLDALGKILSSSQLKTLLVSLLAQINDARGNADA